MKQILISSAILIGIILLLRWLLRGKISRRLQYALWLLVAVRLLVPIQFGYSQYSAAALTEWAEQSQPIRQIRENIQQPVAGPSRDELYEQLLEAYTQGQSEPVTPQIQSELRQEAQTATLPSLSEILRWIWIGGIGVMTVWFLITNLLFHRKLRQGAVPYIGAEATVPVRICPNAPSPCIVGSFRPVICLTPDSVADPRSLSHVLVHEQTHLRHGDHIWAWIRCICLCIYWFDPLVWVAGIVSKRDCELACDEGALKKLGEGERIAYGKTLLDTVTHSLSPSRIMEATTAMDGSKKQMKERMEYIVKKPKKILLATVSAVLVAAIAVGCAFAGDPSEGTVSTRPEEENPQILFDLAHEAEDIFEKGGILTLTPDPYLTEYYRYRADRLSGAVTVTDAAITLDTAKSTVVVEGVEAGLTVLGDLTVELMYMIFLDLLVDRYADAVTVRDSGDDDRLAELFFYPQYRDLGFDTVAACCAAIDAGERKAPEYSFYISYQENRVCWASDPDRELVEPVAPTDPLPSEMTVPPDNTEGPPVTEPDDPNMGEEIELGADPMAEYLIDRYQWYRAVGVCCDFESVQGDMSRYLTEEQKKDYCDHQYRLTCCHSPEQVREHIQKLLGPELIRYYPDELLFTDDAGDLYLIVIPMGMARYRYIEPVGEGVFHAGQYDEDGYLRTVAFTVETVDGLPRLTRMEHLDEGLTDTAHFHRGLHFRLDSGYVAGEDPQRPECYLFRNGQISGSITCDALKVLTNYAGDDITSSKAHAFAVYDTYGGAYPGAWVGDLEQRIWYTVLRDAETTQVHCLYVHGDIGWLCTVRCDTDAGYLARMIEIATGGWLGS